MPVLTVWKLRERERGALARRGGRLWLLPVALALLAAACGGEGTAALVATPAQEPEAGPDVPEGEAASAATTAPTTTIVGAVAPTTSVVVVDEGERVVTTTPDIEEVGPGGNEFGPQGNVQENYPHKTDRHQHSTPGGDVEHEHAYLSGATSHRHEGGKIIYKQDWPSSDDPENYVLLEQEFTEDDLGYETGKWDCTESYCWLLDLVLIATGVPQPTRFFDGREYACPDFVEIPGETVEETVARITVDLSDPEGHGCVQTREKLYDCPTVEDLMAKTGKSLIEIASSLLDDPIGQGCVKIN